MFVCFTFIYSVLNLIYPKHVFFCYKTKVQVGESNKAGGLARQVGQVNKFTHLTANIFVVATHRINIQQVSFQFKVGCQ